MTTKIKCRYCDWEIASFFRTKEGRPRSGFDVLWHHVDDNHYAENQRDQALARGVSKERAQAIYESNVYRPATPEEAEKNKEQNQRQFNRSQDIPKMLERLGLFMRIRR